MKVQYLSAPSESRTRQRLLLEGVGEDQRGPDGVRAPEGEGAPTRLTKSTPAADQLAEEFPLFRGGLYAAMSVRLSLYFHKGSRSGNQTLGESVGVMRIYLNHPV